MGLFDSLVGELKQRFGVGDEVGRLLDGLLSMIADDEQGGLTGFLRRFQNAGLGGLVQSWHGSGEKPSLSGAQVEQALGGATVDRLASQAGMSHGIAASVLASLIPTVIGKLAPGGVVPDASSLKGTLAGAWSGVSRVSGAGWDVAADAASVGRSVAAGVGIAAQAVRHDVGHVVRRRSSFGWGWPVLLVALAAVLGWWLFRGTPANAPATPPLAEAPAQPSVPPAAGTTGTVDPSLSIRNDSGRVTVSGAVPDAAARDRLLASLRSTFGEANVSGDITVDGAARAASWLDRVSDAVPLFKIPGAEVSFDGSAISVGGTMSAADRNSLIEKLKPIFGAGATIGTFADRAGALATSATEQATTALAGLAPGFGADVLVQAMNLSIINFVSGSAEIPAESIGLLKQAAEALKRAPAGTVIEIGGHTDNTGNPAANLRLSQARADAVRSRLVEFGVDTARLVSRGHGGAAPVAGNDTEAGRFRNRRIEYSVAKS